MAAPDRAFPFLRLNQRQAKPRTRGVTEIRGPYYTPMGQRYLHDVLETMGTYVDGLKFGGGSFVLYPRQQLRELIDLCHAHDVYVSTGGFIEAVLPQGPDAVRRYLGECRELGFDVVEVSGGFITVPPDDLVRLVADVQKAGLKAKPAGPARRRTWRRKEPATRPWPSRWRSDSSTPGPRW
jgi:phosphosulfolactate synthase (CoM biosynthesis protein A)